MVSGGLCFADMSAQCKPPTHTHTQREKSNMEISIPRMNSTPEMFFDWLTFQTRFIGQQKISPFHDRYFVLFQAELTDSIWIPGKKAIRLPVVLANESGPITERGTGVYIEVIPLSSSTIELNIMSAQNHLFDWLEQFVGRDMAIRWPEIREYLDKDPWWMAQDESNTTEGEPAIPPWEHIPDSNYNRKMVELLWKGKSDGEIAQELRRDGYSITPKTVSNRLSDLRAIGAYAPYVPRREDIPEQSGKSWE